MEYVKMKMLIDFLWIEGFEVLITHHMVLIIKVMPSYFSTVPITETK